MPTDLSQHVTRITSCWRGSLPFLVGVLAMVLALLPGAVAAQATQPESATDTEVLRTDSPQETFASFLRLRDDMELKLQAYLNAPSLDGVRELALLSDQMVALIDLQEVLPVARREVGIKTATYMMDIFGRVDPPDLTLLPDAASLEDDPVTYARIPGTPLRIVKMTDGAREGEFLFSGQTVQTAPRFLRSLGDMPLRTVLPIQSFSALSPQLTGPLFPPDLVNAVPPSLRALWFDTPIWKVLTMSGLALASLVGVLILNRLVSPVDPDGRLRPLLLKSLVPIAMLTLVLWALPYVMHQLNLSGTFSLWVEKTLIVMAHIAFAWLFWIAVRLAVEWVILSPRIPDESLDANLLRLVSGLIGIIGVAIILAFAGQAIGLPIVSVLAGLGIGGLAVALALRPTLENLVGGVMLYVDRPVRVGDFCCFGGQMGTVEQIGIRSTRIRALDRTLISVPNAQFADMQIINFSARDQILIDETLGLRYQTAPEVMRLLLEKLHDYLASQPKVDQKTLRVRFVGYDDSKLKVNLRLYVNTTDFDEFLCIRERLFLGIYDRVKEVGTDFAFPSQTLYLSRDNIAQPMEALSQPS